MEDQSLCSAVQGPHPERMDLGGVIKKIIRACGTVIREEHDGVARSALSVRACAPRPAHVSAVQVGRLLDKMGYVRPNPESESCEKKHTVDWVKLQDNCSSGVFWADAAQLGLNVQYARLKDDEGSAWGTLSTLPLDAHGHRTFGGLTLKLVFCIVAAADHGLEHTLTLEQVVRFGMREIRKHEKQWQARWPCAFRALAVSYRPLAAAGDIEFAESKGAEGRQASNRRRCADGQSGERKSGDPAAAAAPRAGHSPGPFRPRVLRRPAYRLQRIVSFSALQSFLGLPAEEVVARALELNALGATKGQRNGPKKCDVTAVRRAYLPPRAGSAPLGFPSHPPSCMPAGMLHVGRYVRCPVAGCCGAICARRRRPGQ